MKRLSIALILAGSVLLLTGCATGCGGGGCGYVQSSCCNTTCSTCGYGSGYNDWY